MLATEQNWVTTEEGHARVDQIERALIDAGNTFEPEIHHHFIPGMYLREMRAPADSIITSAEHLTEHPFFLSKGVLAVWDEEGGTKILRAPFCGVTKPGTRRAAYVLKDIVWTTLHFTDSTDVEEIARETVRYHGLPSAERPALKEDSQ